MIYDGVITKPELTEENMLMHWGVKGMRWKKRLKGAYYKGKNKIMDIKTRRARGAMGANMITQDIKRDRKRQKKQTGIVDGISFKFDYTNGKSTSQTGQEGSRVNEGIAAGRQRALEKALKNRKNRPGSRKKKVISGTTSVKKRGVAK